MKIIQTLVIAVAMSLAAFNPLRADDAAASSPSVVAFKKDMEALKAYAKEQEPAIQANQMAGVIMIRTMVTKVKAVKTDGLPADLKDAFTNFVTGLSKMGDLLKDWPEKVEDVQGYVLKKSMEDPKFGEDFGQKMVALQQEIQPLAEKMKEVGKKYGLDDLGIGK